MSFDAVCPRCRSTQLRYQWQAVSSTDKRIRATCVTCGRFVGWAPQSNHYVGLAEPERQTELFPSRSNVHGK